MYKLPYHTESNEGVIEEFILQYPFAFLSGCDSENRPVATQVPLLLEEKQGKQVLRGHIMKHTDHHRAFLHNPNVLVVFNGKHCYVSGSWYSNPHTASTWNYMSVHAKGRVRFLGGSELEDLLRTTTLHFENQDPESPTVYDQLPSAFKQRVMHAIVAFEIEVEGLDAVFKLSQDRDAESYRNIIDKLREQDESGRAIAAEMEKRASELFSES